MSAQCGMVLPMIFELIGLGLAIIGLLFSVWVVRYGKQTERRIPAPNEVTYATLATLVAVSNGQQMTGTESTGSVAEANRVDEASSADKERGVSYDDLSRMVIDRLNQKQSEANFNTGRKNKKLQRYIKAALDSLERPPAAKLDPLVDVSGDRYTVTDYGRTVHQELPRELSERPDALSERLDGLSFEEIDSGKDGAEQSSGNEIAGAPKRATQPKLMEELRMAVLMAAPESGMHERVEFERLIIENLNAQGIKRLSAKKVHQGVTYNLYKGYLRQDESGHIGLATTKADKSPDDFGSLRL